MQMSSLPGGNLALSAARCAARAVVVATFLVCGMTGCQSLYLHSDSTEKATAESKSELDKVDVTSLFDSEAAYLDDLQKREYAAVAESLAAQRDDSLLTILQGPGVGHGNGRAFLQSRIDGYLKRLAGSSDRGAGMKLWNIVSDAYDDVGRSASLADALASHLERDRGKVKAPEEPTLNLFSPSRVSLDEALEDVDHAVQESSASKKAAEQAQADLANDLQKASDQLAAGQASQKTFRDLIDKVNSLLKDAKDKANPYIGQYVSKTLLDSLDHLIEVTDSNAAGAAQDSKARAAIGFVSAAFGVGDAFSSPPRVPHPNALATTRAWLEYVASQSDILLMQARAKETVLRARLDAVARQVYFLSHAGEALEPISSKPAIRDGEGLVSLLTTKDSATSRAASAAIYYYANAWTSGFIPAQQLNEVALPLAERRAKLQQSRQAGDAWVGTLKPAVATLAAYGEGGIDPHVVAGLLQALGIGAIAAGVN